MQCRWKRFVLGPPLWLFLLVSAQSEILTIQCYIDASYDALYKRASQEQRSPSSFWSIDLTAKTLSFGGEVACSAASIAEDMIRCNQEVYGESGVKSISEYEINRVTGSLSSHFVLIAPAHPELNSDTTHFWSCWDPKAKF